MDITDLLVLTQKNNASDLHIGSNKPPQLRINGEMIPVGEAKMEANDVKKLIYSIMTEQQRADFERDLELDFSIAFTGNLRFRVNAYNNIDGAAAVLRCIPSDIMSLEQINAPEIMYKVTNLKKGLVLVTGPTGSGKSTTLAAIIDYINANQAKHILTIEDPVEFVFKSKKSVVSQREVGTSTRSFARALKSALREDPDVIMVGELRDLETIQLAMTAAETGHLVLGTLHTNSASKTVDRIIDVFSADDKEMVRAMLSLSLEAVISQALVKTMDGKGRIAAHEILLANNAVRNLIREAKIPQINSVIQTSSQAGMCTMRDCLFAMVEAGSISEEEAKKHLSKSFSDESDESEKAVNVQASKNFGFKSAGNESF